MPGQVWRGGSFRGMVNTIRKKKLPIELLGTKPRTRTATTTTTSPTVPDTLLNGRQTPHRALPHANSDIDHASWESQRNQAFVSRMEFCGWFDGAETDAQNKLRRMHLTQRPVSNKQDAMESVRTCVFYFNLQWEELKWHENAHFIVWNEMLSLRLLNIGESTFV